MRRRTHEPLTHDRLLERFQYDPSTGVFTNRKTGREPTARSGRDRAYLYIEIDGLGYPAQRLAWFYVNGTWPEGYVDHVDKDTANNRITNLRDATPAQNSQNRKLHRNNRSGSPGVDLHRGKWAVRITVAGRRMHFGAYDDLTLACAIAHEARAKHHGDFAGQRHEG